MLPVEKMNKATTEQQAMICVPFVTDTFRALGRDARDFYNILSNAAEGHTGPWLHHHIVEIEFSLVVGVVCCLLALFMRVLLYSFC